MATLEDVGTVIHVLRVIQSLSQGDLAEISGVRNSSISNYERGKAIPKLETLQKLAEGMGLPLSAVQETQEFIYRMRAQVRRTGASSADPLAFHLARDSRLELPDPDALRSELDQLAADSGRLVTRLLRLLLQILAADSLSAARGAAEASSSEPGDPKEPPATG